MARGLSVALFTLMIAITTRVLNAPFAFENGAPQITPADELYHWKRMSFTARNLPRVLELDRDRGIDGLFVPWPPLYDFAGGCIARVASLPRVVWIPPFAGAIAAALAAAWLCTRFGLLAGIAGGIALAASPFIVTQSSIGNIDHHFLEWPLTFAVMWACVGPRPSAASAAEGGGSTLAIAMTAAMFTQTALIISCALAFVVTKRRGNAFLVTAAAIAIYRVTRAPGYPDSAWFLGWPHVALFLAAGVAERSKALAIAIALAASSALLQGATFFGGDRWLKTIVEFQPMWRSGTDSLVSQISGLSIGAVLVWFLLRKNRTIALFAIVYLVLTIMNRRFWSISIPLLAIAGAVYAASITRKHMRIALAVAVAAIPVVQLALWMRYPMQPIQRYQVPWLQAADFLRTQPQGRVLAPWQLGHTIDVRGGHPVVIDNFGSMPDAILFERAHDALLSLDETRLARFCDEAGVRYVVIHDPAAGAKTAAAILGIDMPEKLMHSLWWWKAYYGEPQFARFRRIHRTSSEFSRAAIVVWEYRGRV